MRTRKEFQLIWSEFLSLREWKTTFLKKQSETNLLTIVERKREKERERERKGGKKSWWNIIYIVSPRARQYTWESRSRIAVGIRVTKKGSISLGSSPLETPLFCPSKHPFPPPFIFIWHESETKWRFSPGFGKTVECASNASRFKTT